MGTFSELILHTAHILSDSVFELDKLNISDNDTLIYLSGHCNLEQRTIGKRSMKEIAEILVHSGFNGVQNIYITSCRTNVPIRVDKSEFYPNPFKQGECYFEMTLAEYLKRHLDTILSTKFNYVVPHYEVISQSEGNSVVVQEYGDNILYVITAESVADKGLLNWQTFKQTHCHDNCVSLSADIEKSKQYSKARVEKYKRELICKEIRNTSFEQTTNWVTLTFGFVFSLCTFGCLYMFGLLGLILSLISFSSITTIGLCV